MPTPNELVRPGPLGSAALTYILFNDAWDRVVGNRINQQLAPTSLSQQALAVPKYLDYLAGSLESFRACHPGSSAAIRLWHVEIDPSGLTAAQVREFVARRAPELHVEVVEYPHELVRPLVHEALALPARFYRSPNRLHEVVMLHALRQAAEQYVAFVDPDVTFLQKGALDAIWRLLAANPSKWVAAFIERPARPDTRTRMHSVAIFFNARALQPVFPFELFVGATSLETRLSALRNEQAVRLYLSERRCDTLSLPTEYLRSNWEVDRVLELDQCSRCYLEGTMLTIVCTRLIHAKYLDPGARPALEDAISRSGLRALRLPEVERLLERSRAL
jgi:hypothetical protein